MGKFSFKIAVQKNIFKEQINLTRGTVMVARRRHFFRRLSPEFEFSKFLKFFPSPLHQISH